MKHNLTILLLIVFSITFSTNAKEPCSTKEASEFNFWIGDWDLTWKDKDGNLLKGTNSIKKVLDGCVIEEDFAAEDSGFKGKSISVYSPRAEKWLQTWVDNNGGYLNFEGGKAGDKMILSRSFTDKNGNNLQTRMVFKNIQKDNFDWSWERSTDGGESWQVNWLIHYKRK